VGAIIKLDKIDRLYRLKVMFEDMIVVAKRAPQV
jgi:hypothetical protein